MTPVPQASTANLLLRAMSAADYALIEPGLERVVRALGETLFEPDALQDVVYFPERGVASVVAEQEGDDRIEVGLYGREGMSGSAALLGDGRSPHRSIIQMGEAVLVRVPAAALLDAFDRSPTLRRVLLRYLQTLFVQAAFTAASNTHYALPERLARWLLMCHDRVDGDRLDLTHEFMATMLAVRRSGVTVTLHTLEGAGAIRSTRGLVTVRSRVRLEEIAGDSYGGAEREYRRLLGDFGKGEAGREQSRFPSPLRGEGRSCAAARGEGQFRARSFEQPLSPTLSPWGRGRRRRLPQRTPADNALTRPRGSDSDGVNA